MKTAKLLTVLLSCAFIAACGSDGSSFSLLSDGDTFDLGDGEQGQSNTKVDILFCG